MSKGRPFHKMNGLGNAIVIVDLRGERWQFDAAQARAIAARPTSRFDQMMVLHDAPEPGTEAYGNGMRCVGWLVAKATGRKALKFATKAGVLDVSVAGVDHISVDMGTPRFGWRDIPLA